MAIRKVSMSEMTNPDRTGLEVAIIGMAGRFPGARTVDQFWQNLRDGVESISFFTDQELEAAGISSTVLNDPNYIKAGGVLENIELFDASFFGYSPREAEIIDPQHRLFLECACEAIENAGYNSETYQGLVGIYAGVGLSTYLVNLYSNLDLFNSVGGYQIGIGNDKDYLTTRVSYKLNLRGPSIVVQTACSTSLAAVHLACQGLLTGECDMALAGGVTVGATQKAGYYYRQGGIASPDGHNRTFDSRAKGTIGSNGVGIVLLKRLEDALVDCDSIQAIIKGTAINNDGALKVGYTAPSIEGQAAVIKAAQMVAEVDPETITYIEAHGTATEIGDPIEVAALTRVFRARTKKKGFCAIGSVKTNIGHLDAAAGIAGLIKTVLALKHKQIPPSLHFIEPNPKIDFADNPFYVNTRLSEWNANGHPRRAGVSSFGIGGTNAHAILEEPPPREQSTASRPRQLLVLSAKTATALDAMTSNLADHLRQNPDINLADVAYTLHVGRRAFSHRRTLVCHDLDQAVKLLETCDPQRVFTSFSETRDRPIVFMFSGQGSQYVNMGLGLYESELTFRKQVDWCAQMLRPEIGLDLREVLYPGNEEVEKASQLLDQTYITQPALFVIEYALAEMWKAWGIHPHAMIGHSIGEYTAAVLAGVFSLEQALALVAVRGRLMQKLPGGAMVSVSLPEQDVRPLQGQHLSLAAVNGESLCVLSGATDAVDELGHRLTDQGIFFRRLRTSHAFHSEMMDSILEPFRDEVRKIKLNPPKIPYVSNLTGTWITDAEATDPNYWVQHLRRTVRFAAGLRELMKEPETIFLEIGPGQTLSGLTRQHPQKIDNQELLSSLRNLRDQTPDDVFLMNTLGRLWLVGKPIDWREFYAQERRHRIQLPTYPFERQRFWVERQGSEIGLNTGRETILKKSQIADWFYLPSWKRTEAHPLRRTLGQLDERFCWLVFLDNCGLGSQMVERWRREGHDVITVEASESFARRDALTYAIDPQRPDDYDSLFKELLLLGKVPKAIIHLWNVSRSSYAQSELQSFTMFQFLGFYSLVFLTQALSRRVITHPLRIEVVTNDMQDVTGQEQLCPDKATLVGPCKVIPQEYPNIICRSIDIVIPELDSSQEEKLVDRLMAEVTGDSSDLMVAYRGNHRWVQVFDLARPLINDAKQQRLRPAGVYMITGGMGYIGLTLAEYLARTVQAKLVLTTRSSFPDKEQWAEWLSTHDDDDEVSRKLRKLQSLEDLGAKVLTLSADVADEPQMRAVVAQACYQFGGLNGVIHTAGFTGAQSVHSISRTGQVEFMAHARPKIEGLLVLKSVLRDHKLDFCLLTSSIASILGGLGFTAYCASNLFMDAFAHKQNRIDSMPWISVNWDSWRSGTEKEDSITIGKTLAVLGLTPEEGMAAFQRVLTMENASQVIISTGELNARINQWVKLDSLRAAGPPVGDGHLSLYPRSNLRDDFVAPRNELEKELINIWQELLGIEPISINDDFFELGGHSLLAIQVVSRVRDLFQVDLNMEALFEGATVAELSLAIVKSQAGLLDYQDISELLAEIGGLSEDDAASMLIDEVEYE
jgi:acyl transferase domain-containing protein/acyl carrier protein